jgi:hypothetical protein
VTRLQMNALHKRICEKNPNGLPYDEAVQLFLWTYITLDILPVDLRGEILSRKVLVETFELLDREEMIVRIPINDGSLIAKYLPITVLFDLLKKGRIELDKQFAKRVNKYL